MNYLGFDFGTKRIGVATGQDITKHATPCCILNNDDKLLNHIAELIATWKPQGLIVGIPQNPHHPDKTTEDKAKKFAQTLAHHFKLPVFEIDEHLSSYEAKQRVLSKKPKQRFDAQAAAVILETWMQEYT